MADEFFLNKCRVFCIFFYIFHVKTSIKINFFLTQCYIFVIFFPQKKSVCSKKFTHVDFMVENRVVYFKIITDAQ